MLYKECKMAEIETLWLSSIKIWGAHFMSESFVFSIIAGWIIEMLSMLFFAYNIALQAEHSSV